MKSKLDRYTIASRAAREFQDGDVVNLGIGIPTLCASFIPEHHTVWLHAENGVLGYGPPAELDKQDTDLINAGTQFVTPTPGISFFNSSDSFNMIRGGHLDITVLGGFQVSEKGDLANWMIPSRGSGNIGGAMELVSATKKVIVAMEHTTRSGDPKLVENCSYPLTGKHCVDMVITDLAVVEVGIEGFTLTEVAPGYTAEEIQSVTSARLKISPHLREIQL